MCNNNEVNPLCVKPPNIPLFHLYLSQTIHTDQGVFYMIIIIITILQYTLVHSFLRSFHIHLTNWRWTLFCRFCHPTKIELWGKATWAFDRQIHKLLFHGKQKRSTEQWPRCDLEAELIKGFSILPSDSSPKNALIMSDQFKLKGSNIPTVALKKKMH